MRDFPVLPDIPMMMSHEVGGRLSWWKVKARLFIHFQDDVTYLVRRIACTVGGPKMAQLHPRHRRQS